MKEHFTFFEQLDHQLAEQDIILDGLKRFLSQGFISQAEYEAGERQLVV